MLLWGRPHTHNIFKSYSCCSMLFLYPSSLNHGNEKLPYCLCATHLGGCHFPRLKCEHPATQWKENTITSLFTMNITLWNQKKRKPKFHHQRHAKIQTHFHVKSTRQRWGIFPGSYISLVGGWTNPFEQICSSNWIMKPQFSGFQIQKNMWVATNSRMVYLYIYLHVPYVTIKNPPS